MTPAERFFIRFPENTEIGRDLDNPDEMLVFYDNGHEVGCFKQDRRTTLPISYEILDAENAECARAHYARKRVSRRDQLDSLDMDEVVKGRESGLAGEPEPGGNASDSYYHGWAWGAVDGGFREKDEHQIQLSKEVNQWIDRVIGSKGLERQR